VKDEQSQISEMMSKFVTLQDVDETTKLLEDMEYLLHAYDNAQVFIDKSKFMFLYGSSL